MHTHTTNFLHVANYFCVRERERERERRRRRTFIASQGSRVKRACVRRWRISSTWVLTYSRISLCDNHRCRFSLQKWQIDATKPQRAEQEISHGARQTHRERERERESYWIRIRSPVFVFMAKFRNSKKSSAKSGYRRRSVWQKK